MNLSNKNRLLQFVLAIAFLVLSAVVTKGNSSLTRALDELEEIYDSFNSTELSSSGSSITNTTIHAAGTGSILGIVSGALTILSHSGLKGLNVAANSYGASFTIIEDSSNTIRAIGITNIARIGALTTSEVSSLILWFVSFILQTAETGSWNCNDAESLLYNYRINSENITNSLIKDFFGQYYLTESKLSLNQSAASGVLSNQADLLLMLSSNCINKKASIGLASIGFFTYIVSGLFVSTSAAKLYQSLYSKKNSDNEEKEADIIRRIEFTDALLFPELIEEKEETSSVVSIACD